MESLKKIVGILCLIVCFGGYTQNCLVKLDSALFFKYSNQEKAKFYANALLADLDSARCPSEIGIASTYNNLGLLNHVSRSALII